jgi:hypothetical protein
MINIDRCLYITEHSFKKFLCQQRSIKMICFILILFSFITNYHFLIYFNSFQLDLQ